MRHVKRLPRSAAPVAWALGATAIHAGVPFALSRIGRRRRPRRGGLLAVAAGGGLMAWALVAHYWSAPRGWPLEVTLQPEYLLRRGPYARSRNPMYVGEAMIWLGWAVFYRSAAAWAGLAVFCATVAAIVPREERRLAERFGDGYRAYLDEVPRWL
jgi:protein-S-isoprenylcysteine O-methyltransferase Ste14